jgi:predicted ATPase/DNA-binding winged helix-turn-helix (wHTH) protein
MVITTTLQQTNPTLKVRFGRFEVDEAEARLLADGEPVRLAPKPFAVLCALARTPHALVTKSALLDRVWGHQYVSESVLKTTISDVRAVLGDDAKQPRYIETVSCRGYRFIGAVAPCDQPAPLPQPIGTTGDEGAPEATLAIGRAAELERLRKAWRSAAAGALQVAWIAGEAGVGKTVLVERFVREVGQASSAHGNCVANFAEAEPGLPILEALTELCRRDLELVELMRQVAPSWLARLPWLSTPSEREALHHELAEFGGQGRMLREFGELLDRYSAQRPLLLVTEDLQWADPLTVQLLDYIARRRSNARLMWLGTFRLTEVIASEHPLATVRQELRLHVLGLEIVLDAFSLQEVAEYLAARVPASRGDAALARVVYERTDGLPLFVADLVDQLLAWGGEEGASATMQQRLAAMPVPETLAGLVERYLHELTPRQRSVLEAASVCGTQFRLSTLADVLEGGVALLGGACAELVRRQRWLREAPSGQAGPPTDGAFVFRHPVYREVLYKRLDRVARVELHRRLEGSLDRERAEPGPAASIVGIRTARVERDRCSGVPMPA